MLANMVCSCVRSRLGVLMYGSMHVCVHTCCVDVHVEVNLGACRYTGNYRAQNEPRHGWSSV